MRDAGHIGLDELQALARAVAMDERLRVVHGEPGAGWRIRADTGHIEADPLDLLDKSAEYTFGLAVHEAAHASITRYPYLLRKGDMHAPGARSLLNALEDCRIETWMLARFSGVRPWVTHYNDSLFPTHSPELANAPLFQQFCLGCIYSWWHGAPVDGTDKRVLDALNATKSARARMVQMIPASVGDLKIANFIDYDGSVVEAAFRRRQPFANPTSFERAVRMSAYRAVRLLWTEIKPAYDELVQQDLADDRDVPGHERELLRTLREVRMTGLRGVQTGADTAFDRVVPHTVPPISSPMRRAANDVVDDSPSSAYEAARRHVASLVQRLVDELERVLRPASYPRWVPGFSSGSRVDVRQAMQLQADPRTYERLWQRKTLPRSFDPAFVLLLDLSGSMCGERIEHGFRGTVLLAEVLAQLAIPFAVCGFQDVLLTYKELGVPLDESVKHALGAMPAEVEGARHLGNNRPEHNWDGPALEAAAKQLTDYGASDAFIIVVSDGEPSGPKDGERALHDAVRYVLSLGIHVVGVGLGPGTEHVRRYYPDHLAETPLQRFPAALGQRLEALLTASA
ncbi:MAG: hypothetical protein ACI9MC_001953 [Kiritimatiellia bacterium]